MYETNQNQEYYKSTERFFLYGTYGLFIFIFYASLLPYNFVPSPLGPSFHSFIQTLQFSQTGAEQGQWIAHVIFNVLLIYFASSYCYIRGQKNIWFRTILFIILFGFLIEYLQMFIGSRGTSMSDVYANISGDIIGFVCWLIFGKYTMQAVKYISQEKKLPINVIKNLYLAFVIIILLFPFDFFINSFQIRSAFALKGFPLFENNPEEGIGIISTISSFMLLFPLGVLYKLSVFDQKRKHNRTLIKGAFLLLFMEVLQFFEVSGQSSLMSFLLKFIGFGVGFYLGNYFYLKYMMDIIIRFRKIILLSMPIFIFLALTVKGLNFSLIITTYEIQTILKEMSLLPFNYYVDVGSAEALLSFLLNFIIYLPIGIYLSLYHISNNKIHAMNISKLITIAILIAFTIESLVFIFGGRRPDITNLLIAMLSMPTGYFSFLMAYNSVKNSSNN